MKSGANKLEQNKIARMAEAGTPVDEISRRLGIDPKAVANFIPPEELGELADVAEVPETEEE